ncbi:MAG: electron transfer flavoprotein subunit alpha [Bryobacteraceae bacterium]|nr:electron transfer flavoprotein subunit alpha [Bryobacteraceae bacterium]
MERLLLLLHADESGSLPKVALECIESARTLGGQLDAAWTVGLVGGQAGAAAAAIGSCGAARFLAVEGPDFDAPRYATDAAAAEALCLKADATLVLAPATSRWMRALPGVAQRLGGRVDTHVVGVSVQDGAIEIQRWYYRQRMEAVLTRAARPWIVLADPGASEAWGGAPQEVSVETVSVEVPESLRRTTVIGARAAESGAQTIRPDAALLFVAGAGWTKKQKDGQVRAQEASELILDIVRKAQASLGSSKSLVDLAGEGQAVLPFLTHLHQVGQTGSTPRHPKGLATCCHGEEPHVVGWRFINERRAVNLDPNCGWARGKADVLYVADAFEVVRKVNELLDA